jgi:hypothetical protein
MKKSGRVTENRKLTPGQKAAATRNKGRGRLIRAYAEELPGTVLDVFWREFKDLLRGQSGIYVLLKNGTPHYVGQAANLPFRIKNHLKDRLQGRWDAFSFYVVGRTRYLTDLETLLSRIVNPRGAKVIGRLRSARNLRKNFIKDLKRYAGALKDLRR